MYNLVTLAGVIVYRTQDVIEALRYILNHPNCHIERG